MIKAALHPTENQIKQRLTDIDRIIKIKASRNANIGYSNTE